MPAAPPPPACRLGFRKRYLLLAGFLLLLEVLIGAFAHDRIIRPYGGDFLVVILLYCFVRAFVTAPAGAVATAVLLLAYSVEASQRFHLVARLGLQHSQLARLVLGSQFAWGDMLAYTLGALLAWGLERRATLEKTGVRRRTFFSNIH